MIVSTLDETRAGDNEGENRGDLQQHHDVVGFSRLANPTHEHNSNDHHDQECRNVEPEVPSWLIDKVPCQIR